LQEETSSWDNLVLSCVACATLTAMALIAPSRQVSTPLQTAAEWISCEPPFVCKPYTGHYVKIDAFSIGSKQVFTTQKSMFKKRYEVSALNFLHTQIRWVIAYNQCANSTFLSSFMTFGELNSCELGVFRFKCFLLLLLRLLLNKHS